MNQDFLAENNEKKIAYCIPTYNHPEVIEEVFPMMLSMYMNYNMDIHFFDSSEDDRTKDIIDQYTNNTDSTSDCADNNNSIVDRIFYHKVSWGSDEKYLNIAKGTFLENEYDYIWIVKDRALFFESALEEVSQHVKDNPDAICLPVEDVSKLVLPDSGIVFDDPVSFFRYYGCASTSWEVIIFSTKLLNSLNWDDLENSTPVGTDCPFNQTLILFNALYEASEKGSIKIDVLKREKSQRGYSSKSKSMWLGRIVELWGEKWPKMMNTLPSCYNEYKEEVIRDGVSLPPVWGSYDNLYILKNENILTYAEWEILKTRWEKLSKLPAQNVELLMADRLEELVLKVYNEFVENMTSSNVEKAYINYLSLNAIADNLGPEVSEAIEKVFEIYAIEHGEYRNDMKSGEIYFESGCSAIQNFVDKYSLVKLLVKKLNDKAPAELIAPLVEMKNRLGISDLALKYAMKTIKF